MRSCTRCSTADFFICRQTTSAWIRARLLLGVQALHTYFVCSDCDGTHFKVKDAGSLDEDALPGSLDEVHSKLF